MWKQTLVVAALAACGWAGGPAAAADSPAAAAQEPIYGSQLMTPYERSEYRRKMQQADTAAEREQIRQGHHDDMQQRAREKGMTLPQQPPGRRLGSGMSRGPGTMPGMSGGMGSGMGNGTSGMGEGPAPGMGGGSGMGPGTNGGLRPRSGTGPRGTTP